MIINRNVYIVKMRVSETQSSRIITSLKEGEDLVTGKDISNMN